jgi:hypothetical protein
MTGAESRVLYVGARVCWESSVTDRGTVSEVDWSAVKIIWDNGQTTSVRHNDMARVKVVRKK